MKWAKCSSCHHEFFVLRDTTACDWCQSPVGDVLEDAPSDLELYIAATLAPFGGRVTDGGETE